MKKNMAFIFFVSLTLFLIIHARHSMIESLYAKDPIERAFSKTSQKTGLYFEEKTPNLKFLGFGGIYKNDIMEKQYIHFLFHQKVNQNKGTRLISNLVNFYMNTILSTPSLENYLNNNTFDYKNIEIVLYIQHEDGTPIHHPNIGIIELSNGIISYTTTKSTKKGDLFEEKYFEESYEKALKRIEK